MIGAGAVQTIALARFANADALLNMLSGGGAVSARVVSDSAGLALALPNARLPLPEGSSFPPGTAVRVQIVEQDGTKQLQIRPQPVPAPQSAVAPNAGGPYANLLAALIPALSAAISREHAAVLMPKAEGLPRETIRGLLELLVGRESVSAQLARVGDAIEAAVSSGKLPADVRDRFTALLNRFHAETSAEFERALVAARTVLRGRSPDVPARIERSVLDEIVSLRSEIASRRDALGGAGETVLRSLDALIDRSEAGRLQNVRGFEAPYQFLEVPLSRASGYDRAHVHIFGDESRGAGTEERSHSVVLDLELSKLGAIWIHLHSAGEACSCVMRASAEPAVRALDEAASSLADALHSAGYGDVSVRAEAWDGDRVSALAAMSSRFSGFEAHA